MKRRIGVLLAAAAAVMLLTAGTARQARQMGPLTDHQMSLIVGGEKEKGCSDKYTDAMASCGNLTTTLEIQVCKGVAALELASCTVQSVFSWFFSLIF